MYICVRVIVFNVSLALRLFIFVCVHVCVCEFFMQKYFILSCIGIHTFAEVAVTSKSYGNVEDTGCCS